MYSKADCPLCDAGTFVVEKVARRLAIPVEKVDIEPDPALQARYRERVPVVEFEGAVVAEGRIEERALEARLAPAGAKRRRRWGFG